MNVSFHGAARSVTGSRHLIEAGNSRVLLDCGMFQGRRGESDRRNRELGVEPRWLDAVILSHAHIDHSGALPILTQHAFRGRVHATEATCDLTQLMLEDSARIQEQDCQYVNKRERRRRGTWREPYYNTNDVRAIVRRFSGERYHQDFKVTPTITARFYDAGHILGSTAIHVTISQRGTRQSILFTGDLGRSGMPILRDPDPPPPCDVLIIESTYGDRFHEDEAVERTEKAKAMVAHAIAHKSKIVVPAFAVGRTQDLVMRIKSLVRTGAVPPIPIFIDSPLARKATEIFRRHPGMFDEETFRTFTKEGDPFAARFIHYVSTVEESKRLNDRKGPCVIIASSGMCEGGRVLHHLKHALPNPDNIVAIVGFQAEHTLGRKLIEEWDTVPIFGIPTPRRARIERFNGFSAHADRGDLLAYIRAIHPTPSKVFIVHGEERQSLSLAAAIQAEYPGLAVEVPRPDSSYDV
ncbi:MBL fold hydrolase [Nitrospira sp.]|nr:MBL fold hydrolase [Nitrospira sp.]